MELDEIREKLRKEKEQAYLRELEYWKTRKPFQDVNDIPDIPIVKKEDYQNIIIPNIIRCGGIPKSELKPHTVYIGGCRNSSEAEWTGSEFIYCRHKWGTEYIDDVQHFEDGADNEEDVFVPIKEKIKESN